MEKLNSLLTEYAQADYTRQDQIYKEICVDENIDGLINSFATEDQTIIQSAQQLLLDLDISALKRLMIYFVSTKNVYIENYTANTIKYFDDKEIIKVLLDLKPENFAKNELNKLFNFLMSFLDLKELNDEELEKLEIYPYFKDIQFIQKLEIYEKKIKNDDLIRLKNIFLNFFKSNNQEILQYINELEISDNNRILLTKYFLPMLYDKNVFIQQNSVNFLYSISNEETKNFLISEHSSNKFRGLQSQLYKQNLFNIINRL